MATKRVDLFPHSMFRKIFGFNRGFDYFEDFDLHTEKRNLSGEVVAGEIVSRYELVVFYRT